MDNSTTITQGTNTTTVAEGVVEWLREQGIGHVFGAPSGAWLPYMQAMKAGGVEFVLVSNEATAGFMACTYSWLKGVPGVCYATIGPGATNLSTGVGAAYLNRVPVLAFTTEPPDEMRGRTVQMAIDQQALYKPITKETTRLSADTVRATLDEALRVANAEVPGPVHIGLPEDLAGAEHKEEGGAARASAEPPMKPASEQVLEEMVGAFTAAKRPVVAVGIGAVRSGLAQTVQELAERHELPVVLTPMAKGMVPEKHRSYAGVLFHALSDKVAETHRKADLVIGVGYDPVEFNYEAWMPQVKLVHIDVKAADIDRKQYGEVLNVVGAIEPALRRLVEAKPPVRFDWDLEALGARREAMFAEFRPKAGSFGPLAVLQGLREHLPEDGIMSCDVGAHTHVIGQMWPTPRPYSQLMDNGWSSMGFGVPAALGAKVAAPDREVACVTGDGGFLMMAGEMATARRLGMRIVFVVLCDNSLDLIRIKQQRKGLDSYGTGLGSEVLDMSNNSIFGVPVLPATDEQTYRQALERAFSSDGPVIIQASIDASEYDGLILRKHK